LPPLAHVTTVSDPDILSSFRADPLRFLSAAPADSLDLLPGIGPVLANRIAVARDARGPFTSWDDVLEVRGIGPRTVERLRAMAGSREARTLH
jgi:competence protein ComEA